ncbi:hypothetical protein QN219_01005 [Sinorhizobium sp. 7-81]|uniref:hypothetical protein n=1 Tax=Sinorhizobium sp. 8-89 TaxID=3049089 RepID=UPI0024C2AF2D|nr:hypothetical protein [Sinorhizobium sp. 8-89]MDK1488642.1 hypothetical protein [Sinorhizobium sp. 8-89]
MLEDIWHWTKLAFQAALFGWAGANIVWSIDMWQDDLMHWFFLFLIIPMQIFALGVSVWSFVKEWSTYDTDMYVWGATACAVIGYYWVPTLKLVGDLLRFTGYDRGM